MVLLLVLAALIHLSVYSCGSARKLLSLGVSWLLTKGDGIN